MGAPGVTGVINMDPLANASAVATAVPIASARPGKSGPTKPCDIPCVFILPPISLGDTGMLPGFIIPDPVKTGVWVDVNDADSKVCIVAVSISSANNGKSGPEPPKAATAFVTIRGAILPGTTIRPVPDPFPAPGVVPTSVVTKDLPTKDKTIPLPIASVSFFSSVVGVPLADTEANNEDDNELPESAITYS